MLKTVQALSEKGALKKWGKALEDLPDRRSVMLGEATPDKGGIGGRGNSPYKYLPYLRDPLLQSRSPAKRGRLGLGAD